MTVEETASEKAVSGSALIVEFQDRIIVRIILNRPSALREWG